MSATPLDVGTWYREQHPRVLAALTVASGRADIAAEATDEAFVRAYERWDRVRRMDSPGGWLHRVAFNDLRRRQRRRAVERDLLLRRQPVTGTGGGGRGITVGDGDYVMFDDVDLGSAIATGFDVRLASAAGPVADGRVEVRMDGLDAPPFVTVVVTGTGGRDTFEVLTAATPAIEGVHDFYVTFSSEQDGDLAVVDWFRFQS